MSRVWLALLLWAAGAAVGAPDGGRSLNVSDRCLSDVQVFLRDISLDPPQHYAALSKSSLNAFSSSYGSGRFFKDFLKLNQIFCRRSKSCDASHAPDKFDLISLHAIVEYLSRYWGFLHSFVECLIVIGLWFTCI